MYLAVDDGRPVDGPVSALLVRRLGVESAGDFRVAAAAEVARFGEYESATIGGALGAGAEFSIAAAIELDRQYHVFVRAVGLDGRVGPPSRIGTFLWAPAASEGPEVPWPAWPLAGTADDPRLVALRLAGDEYPVGVRLGTFEPPGGDSPGPGTFLGKIDPADLLFRRPGNVPVLPLVLYRCQVPNASYPRVSGDVVQVSPLLERIAHEHRNTPGGGSLTVIRDPFFEVFRPPGSTQASVVLRDLQPVIAGARYLYLLVRFDPATHEIVETLSTQEIEP